MSSGLRDARGTCRWRIETEQNQNGQAYRLRTCRCSAVLGQRTRFSSARAAVLYERYRMNDLVISQCSTNKGDRAELRRSTMKELKRCTRCIIPQTFPGISFNKEGVCSLCQKRISSLPLLGEKKLLEILRTRKGRTYDCVVPLSGGKDSTYVLYYAVKKLNLRAIAVNYDSGFQSDLGKQNMEKACNSLKVPLVVKKAPYKNRLRLVKDALRLSQALGAFLFTCTNCEANIRTTIVNTAKQYSVPFILYGSTGYGTTGQEHLLSRDSTVALRRRIIGIFLRNPFALPYYTIKLGLHSLRERIHMKTPTKYLFRRTLMPFPEDPKIIHVFDYLNWDPKSMMRILKEQIGWNAPSGNEARFDCLLHCFENHRWLQQCGISSDGFVASSMIRKNLIRREVALDNERQLITRIQNECSDIACRFGLRNNEIPMI